MLNTWVPDFQVTGSIGNWLAEESFVYSVTGPESLTWDYLRAVKGHPRIGEPLTFGRESSNRRYPS